MDTFVTIRGWKPGLHKVALTALLRERAGLSLYQAHDHVNRLLAGETLSVAVPATAAAAFADEALDLGVEAAVVGAPVGI